jgi:hypothetical protein
MKKITYLLFIILSLASCATSKRIEKSPKPEEGFDAELIG